MKKYISPLSEEIHTHILKSFGHLLPKKQDLKFDTFTYSDFAEEIKKTYSVHCVYADEKLLACYNHLLSMGDVKMFDFKNV